MYRGINPEDVWKIWSDINNWKDWFHDVEFAQIEGELSANAAFYIQFKNESPITYKIIRIFDGYKFISARIFFGATLYDTRALDTSIDGVRLVRTITLAGPLAWFWKYKIAKQIMSKSSLELEALASKAQKLFYTHLPEKKKILKKNL